MSPRRSAADAKTKTGQAELAIGAWVEIEGMGNIGRVIELDARRKQARVLVGSQEWSLPAARLRVTSEAPAAEKPSQLVRVVGSSPIVHSIDLHGLTVEDALAQADRAIDQAVVAHLRQLKIIHGHGTGALRTAIRKMLASHPHVAHYRFAGPVEGGLATTIAELKEAPR